MMRTTKISGAILIGMLFVLPVSALAEDTSAQGSVDASVSLDASAGTPPAQHPKQGDKPVPMLYKIEGGRQGVPAGGVAKGARMASGTKPLPKGMEMRDKMMASGTKPIPKGIEDRMEGRDNDRMRMMGSGTPERMGRGDCMKDASSSDCKDKHDKGERRGEMMKRAAEVVFNRIDAAIKRFNKIADRIDSRIAKLNGEGTETSAAEADVAAARAKTKEAQDALDAARTLVVTPSVTTDASSTALVDAGKPVREQLEKAKQALMAAAKDLQTTIMLLKGEKKDGDEGMHDGTSSPKMPSMMRTKDHMPTGTPSGATDGAL